VQPFSIVDGLVDLLTKANVEPLEIAKADAIDALVRARAFESAPITDALIAASARAHGALPVYTFDRKFGRLGAAAATPGSGG
jgi:predicted nucleic acid-binding protein